MTDMVYFFIFLFSYPTRAIFSHFILCFATLHWFIVIIYPKGIDLATFFIYLFILDKKRRSSFHRFKKKRRNWITGENNVLICLSGPP